MLYRFDDFELDTERFELRHNGAVRHVEPLVFDLICFLSQNAGRVLSRDDIIADVWKGRIVSDATVSSCIKSARQALGDSGEQQTYIKTVRGRGFQFAGQIAIAGDDVPPATVVREKSSHSTTQPSLIVLPFEVFGEGRHLAALADGLVENLTTILTRVPLLAVVSRSSSFALKGEPVSAQSVRERFAVSYMLEGSLQDIGGAVRANVQLIETRNGFHLWAQQFDCPAEADCVPTLLCEILPRLEPQLVRAIFNDVRGESDEPSSRQLLLQAMGLLALKGWHRSTFEEAADLLRRSIKLEPNLALAHGYLALILGLGHRVGLLEKSDAVAREALGEADIALELDNGDSNVVGLAGCAIADCGQPARAQSILKTATDLNPNNAQAWSALGSAYLILRDPQQAIQCLSKGIEISPMDNRLSVWWSILAIAHLSAGDMDCALSAAQSGCQSDDKSYLPRLALAAVNLARKDAEATTRAVTELHRVKPDISSQEIDSFVGAKTGAVIADLVAKTNGQSTTER